MKAEEIYVQQVLKHILHGRVRDQIEAELRGSIADRIERGGSADDAIRQLGDPRALAESYLSAVPMRKPPHIRRGLAKLVDLVIVFLLPCMVFFFCWTAMHRWQAGTEQMTPSIFYGYLAAYLVALGVSCWYPILMEHFSGQTLGKRMFGLQVVTEKGARISVGQAIVRQLPIFLQVFTIDWLFALFTDRRQRAFEMLSKTRVVDVSEETQPTAMAAPAMM